jgi:hypothetical protein
MECAWPSTGAVGLVESLVDAGSKRRWPGFPKSAGEPDARRPRAVLYPLNALVGQLARLHDLGGQAPERG